MACCSPQTSKNETSLTQAPLSTPKVHLHVHAPELGAAIDFYRAFFGAEPVKIKPGYAKFLPTWAPVNLALSEHAAGTAGGAISHVGIQLPSRGDVRKHLDRIQALGLPTRVEMGVTCCHANQDKFWVRDPSGIDWEVYHLNHDVEDTEPVNASAACCAS